MSGRWVSVTMADGATREDWVPVEQPPAPDGQPGQWHIVTNPAGVESTWEWHAWPAPALPHRPGQPPRPAAQPVSRNEPRAWEPEPEEGSSVLGWRKGTWIILAFNLLMLVWVAAGGSQAVGNPSGDCGVLSAHACNEASDTGTAIGVALIIGLWVAGDVILGVIWLVTNTRYRECPACGRKVKKGQYSCQWCRHDFRSAIRY